MDILIIKPSSLGDIVHGLQVAQSIKAGIEGCRITWVVGDRFRSFVEDCPSVDAVLIYRRLGGLRGFWRLLREIRRERFDIALDFQGLARSGMMLLAARSPRKIGRFDARDGSWISYSERVARPEPGKVHALDILMQFLPHLGLPCELEMPLNLGGDSSRGNSQVGGGRRPVVLFPGSRRPEKDWKGFYELSGRLLEVKEVGYLVWAGDRKIAGVGEWDPDRFLNLTGRTTLRELVALIKRARLVVANDSGPMHIAAALELPVVALFGPTAPERFGPYPLGEPRNRVLRAPGGELDRLGTDEVFQAVVSLL